MMNRRHFLKLAAAAPIAGLAPGLVPTLAFGAAPAGADYRRLLILIELKGGNDGLNTLVPYASPAYYALLAEAMIEAGILLGLSREISTKLVVQTMLGTAHVLRDEQMHPVELREAVTSPGGTTIRAIRELERAGVRAAFLNAIQAAMERSQELAQDNS